MLAIGTQERPDLFDLEIRRLEGPSFRTYDQLVTYVGEAMQGLDGDYNDDGVVNSGAELFGDATPIGNGYTAANGFLALGPVGTQVGSYSVDFNFDSVIDFVGILYPTSKLFLLFLQKRLLV